jgi:beta-1,4-N-acetylglucosaminyltransferase
LVFVTVGNATQEFRRLLECVDMLAGQGFFNDEVVVIQRGNNPEFLASYCKQEDFLTMNRFTQMIREADLVICHAGAGALINVFQAGKVPVVMPRRKKYSEHVDDHQLELVKALSTEGRVVPAYEPENLPDAIAEARRRATQPVLSMPPRMLDLVAQAIKALQEQRAENLR